MYRHHNIAHTAQPTRPMMSQTGWRRREPIAPTHDWQAEMVASYTQALEEQINVAVALAARVYALTGRAVTPESIFVDRASGLAVAVVDGVTFRMRQGQLRLLRPCAQCGIGHFESQPLATRADVGYALSAWEPRHPGCQPEDPANWLES